MAELNVVQSVESLKAHQVPRHYSKSDPTILFITTAYLSPPFWICWMDSLKRQTKAPTSTGATTQTPFLFLNVSGVLNLLNMHTRLAGPSHKASSASDWWGGWATQDSCPQASPFANQVFVQTGSHFHTGIAGFSAPLLLIEDFILEGIHPSGPELKVAVLQHFSTQWPVSLGEAQLTQVVKQRR
jgi:hypothetical protein